MQQARFTFRFLPFAVLQFSLGFSCITIAAAVGRGVELDDLAQVEKFGSFSQGGPIAFSADGQRLAFVWQRSQRQTASRQFEAFEDHNADIWIQLEPNAAAINLTHGEQDSSGAWAPQWSPDGEHLALLSTRGGEIGLWVWHIRTRQFTCLARRRPSMEGTADQPYAWLDNQRLVYVVEADDARTRITNAVQEALEPATLGWENSLIPGQTTAIVRQSGLPSAANTQPQREMLLLDLTGATQIIAQGEILFWRPSPDSRSVGLVKQAASSPTAFAAADKRAEIIGLSGATNASIHLPRIYDGTLCWFPEGNEIAFLGFTAGGREPSLYRLAVNGEVSIGSLEGIVVGNVMRCAAKRNVLIQTAPDKREASNQEHRFDWWRFDARGRRTSLTARFKTPPKRNELYLGSESRTAIMIADSALWSIDILTGEAKRHTPQLQSKVMQLWPDPKTPTDDSAPRAGRTYPEIVIATPAHHNIIQLRDSIRIPIPKIAPSAELLAYSSASGDAVYLQNDNEGLYLWRVDPQHDRTQLLKQGNAFLRETADPVWQLIQYTSIAGEPLTAWLLLPQGYQSGKPYPLLTVVYPETVFTPETRPNRGPANLAWNYRLAASRGYAVLFPSMPLTRWGTVDDPMLKLPNGVMPAIDKTIALGIADSSRLFLMGISFGGFATNALLSQTGRFRAGVSISGISNLISEYGVIGGEIRYTEKENVHYRRVWSDVQNQQRMIVPPWHDAIRYQRNSPLLNAGAGKTPLMLIACDTDNVVSAMQSEEHFMALLHIGVPAVLVNYVGGSHAPIGVANLQDMWRRIFEWFDSDFSQIESE